MFYNVFMAASARAKAMNRDLIPGGPLASRRTSQMFLLFIGLLHFQPGNAVNVNVGFIMQLSTATKPTKLVETSTMKCLAVNCLE